MAGYVEKQLKALENRIADAENRLNVNAFHLQKKLDELLAFQEKAKLDFLEIEKKLASIEETAKSHPEPKVLEQRVVERVVEKPVQPPIDVQALEKRVEEAVGAVDIKSLEEKFDEKIKAIEDLLMLLELEVVKAKEHAPPEQEFLHTGMPKEWEDRLAVLEQKISALEKAKFKIPAERLDMDERLRSIEDNFLSLEARMKEESRKLEEMVAGKALTEESTERFIQKLHDRIEELRRDVDRAQLLKNELFQRERDFAKRGDFENFQNFISSEISRIKQVVDRVAALERSTDTRLIDIEERLSSELQKHAQAWKADIASHRRDIDLAVIKTEEKLLNALSEEVKRVEEVMASQRAEIENLIKVERLIEHELEARATRIVTKELGEFASVMDKRFPRLASRDDFERFAAEVLSKVEKIEAPDISPLLRRIEEMEKRFDDLNRLLGQVASRMPLVME